MESAEKKTRADAVTGAIGAFRPTEPVQTMLASQVVGHHLILLDTFRDIVERGASTRPQSTGAMQTRMTIALIKELRIVRAESLAEGNAPAQTKPPAPAVKPRSSAPVLTKPPFNHEQALADLKVALGDAMLLDKPEAQDVIRQLEQAAKPHPHLFPPKTATAWTNGASRVLSAP